MFSNDLYQPIGKNSFEEMQYVEITNSGTPAAGINPNWDAFNLWTRVEQEADRIKKLPCNRKYQ